MSQLLDKRPVSPAIPPNKNLNISKSTRFSGLADRTFQTVTLLFAFSAVLLIISIAGTLFWMSRAGIHHMGWSFFTTKVWDPVPPDSDKPLGSLFGVLPFLYGTVVTSALAMLIAIPIGLGAAIFLSELAPKWLKGPISFLVELLAAVPSIVYGFAALKYLVPLFQQHVEIWLNASFGQLPFFSMPDTGISGQDFLVAGTVLSIMILPFVTAVARDVLNSVPMAQREAAIALGATRWEAIRGVVLKNGSSGIIGAGMLALGRAVGETMAVTIVIGNSMTIPAMQDSTSFSLFRAGNTMSSILANQYGNQNGALHLSSLTFVAFTLFLLTIIINGLARSLVWLTKANVTTGSGSSWQTVFRTGMTTLGKYFAWLFFAALFCYQIWRDISFRGIHGLTGGAELASLFIVFCMVLNRVLPGRILFLKWREINSGFSVILCWLSAFTACAALVSVLFIVTKDGFSSLNTQFFMRPNAIHPEQGGMLHAIVGTSLFLAMAAVLSIPTGIMGGLFLAEFGNSKLGSAVRFSADLLSGVPSIVIGIFAFTLIVLPTHSNFGIAGGFALGVMAIPTIMRTTEELVRLVPSSMREASLALGATHLQTVWKVVLPAARNGIVTGVLLALSRIAGETAPLLIAAGSSSLWQTDIRGRLASLPMQIFTLSDQPDPLSVSQSWAASLVLVAMVFVFSLLARVVTRNKMQSV